MSAIKFRQAVSNGPVWRDKSLNTRSLTSAGSDGLLELPRLIWGGLVAEVG